MLAASNKKILEAVKELHLSTELRGMNTYAMYVSFFFFFFIYIYEFVTILFLLCQYGVWSAD